MVRMAAVDSGDLVAMASNPVAMVHSGTFVGELLLAINSFLFLVVRPGAPSPVEFGLQCVFDSPGVSFFDNVKMSQRHCCT